MLLNHSTDQEGGKRFHDHYRSPLPSHVHQQGLLNLLLPGDHQFLNLCHDLALIIKPNHGVLLLLQYPHDQLPTIVEVPDHHHQPSPWTTQGLTQTFCVGRSHRYPAMSRRHGLAHLGQTLLLRPSISAKAHSTLLSASIWIENLPAVLPRFKLLRL